MAKSHAVLNDDQTEGSSLAALNRSLELLESRLARMAPAASSDRGLLKPGTTSSSPAQPAMAPLSAPEPAPTAPSERRRSSLADAVSEIVMRRQMLDDLPHRSQAAAPSPRTGPSTRRSAEPENGLGHRLEALVGDVDALRAEGTSYALMTEVATELQNLRREMKQERESLGGSRFEAIHRAFDGLRQLMSSGAGAEAIGARMDEISSALVRLTDEGADRATLNTLRAELEELRRLLSRTTADSDTPLPGTRQEAFEHPAARQTDRDIEQRNDLQQELERLRESLGSLASEDQVRAVEKRWEEFENRYHAPAQGADGEALSKLLRDELESMREKLETMHSATPPAVEERWGALERRLDSREVESSVQRLAERIGNIEASLAGLPASLGIGPLEERIRVLAASVEGLARRGVDAELEHFLSLEERLDEISRAIVATSLQTPTIDMAPIERIEARIATLTSRVDRFAAEDNSEALATRIAELSQRVEDLASNALTDQLSERISGLADRLETVSGEWERPQVDTAAIEARLAALALRLEAAEQPRVDQDLMRSLEAQISRLSEHLATPGTLSNDDFDNDFDRRLAAVEQRLDENREALIAAAREAADETARRMQAAGDQRQSEHVAQLSDNLRSLEQLSRDNGDRSNQVFDAVHLTLRKIVDRLEMIETELTRDDRARPAQFADPVRVEAPLAVPVPMAPGRVSEADNTPRGLRAAISRHLPGRGAAETASQAEDQTVLERQEVQRDPVMRERLNAPTLDTSDMLDSSEVNRPLEPGSGAPDIGALLERVRLQQRSKLEGTANEATGEAETRAAARRAAKAAVAEAETLRSLDGSPKQSREGLSGLLSRRRKTILMAVTAVLVALAAMPIGNALLAPAKTSSDQVVQIEGAAVPRTDGKVGAIDGETAGVSASSTPVPPVSQSTVDDMMAAEKAVPFAPQPMPTMASDTSSAPSSVMAAEATVPAVVPLITPPASSFTPQNAAAEDDTAILARAVAKLPRSAAGVAPAFPSDLGTPALVQATEAADPKALFEVGLRLLEGRGSQPNPGAALDWFAQAARRGFAPAQYSLGTLFEKGSGVTRDTGAARDWYLLAANQGNIRAMHNLAVLYATGIEGKSEPETAATWFEKAADYGMRDSQYNLGILYARGSGVEQNLSESYKWFAIVAEAGDKDAEGKKNEIGEQLSTEQRAAADLEIAQWKAKTAVTSANSVDIPQEWSKPGSDNTASIDMTRAIRNIQAILGKLGYDAGTPDGVIGDKTTAAIQAFQKQAGLTANGKIDETLIRALLARKNG